MVGIYNAHDNPLVAERPPHARIRPQRKPTCSNLIVDGCLGYSFVLAAERTGPRRLLIGTWHIV